VATEKSSAPDTHSARSAPLAASKATTPQVAGEEVPAGVPPFDQRPAGQTRGDRQQGEAHRIEAVVQEIFEVRRGVHWVGY
jgi:hypothetical protein